MTTKIISARLPTYVSKSFRPARISSFHLTTATRALSTMKALVYNGINDVGVQEREKPAIKLATDAIVKLQYSTICGTDLHIIKGDVPSCQPGTTLGHEGVGVVEQVGSAVQNLREGDNVLISAISSCGTCEYCRKSMPAHCTLGGWVLGNTINGTQAEYVRIPNAASSLSQIPENVDHKSAVMLSDILPTGFECGALNSHVQPGSTVVLVGAGPVGLAALLGALLYSPAHVIAVDKDPSRLQTAKELGATHTATPDKAKELVYQLTDGKGADSVMEAVGIPVTFESCQELVARGGSIANVGVHGTKVDLHLEKLWDRNIAIRTSLVNGTTTPMLLKLFSAGRLPADKLFTHNFKFSEILKAYQTYQHADKNKALKVIIEM